VTPENAKSRTSARIRRLNRTIDLGEMLYGLGYDVYPDQHREQQFRCDLHGEDNKPSARFYPETNSTYCWVCQKARGPVDYYIEKESVELREALDRLELLHGLTDLPWAQEDAPQSLGEWIDEQSRTPASFEEDRKRLRKLLEAATLERDLSMDTTLKLWEVFDRIDHGMRKESWTPTQGRAALRQLRTAFMESLQCSPDSE